MMQQGRFSSVAAKVEADLGTSLIEHGLLDPMQLEYARQKQEVTGEQLSQIVVRLGLVSESGLAGVLAQHYRLEFVDESQLQTPDAQAIELFTRETCLSYALLPLRVEQGRLHAALGNGSPVQALELVKRRTGLDAELCQSSFSAVSNAIEQAYSRNMHSARAVFQREYNKIQRDTHGALPIDSLVNALLELAVVERSTDIHVQPELLSIHVSFRIDGVLVPIVAMDRTMSRLTSATKVLAAMDISDNMRPQDGRFSVTLNSQRYDIRVSTSNTPHGESLVMRLLPKGASVAGMNELGFIPEHLGFIDRMFRRPHGMFLMTGPTGSGKTTTLHAGLRPMGMRGKSIMTVEDPIEYELPVACQTQVNRKAGYHFDTAVRHFLRHDPDIMLVGEIRDVETAEAATRAAETGHLVLSTLHVNTVFGVVSRLCSLGVDRMAIAETLIGCINQRLVRQVCEQCREPSQAPDNIPAGFGNRLDGIEHFKGRGCEDCRFTGYQGRLPVYEILRIDEAVAHWIESSGGHAELEKVIGSKNHVSIWESAAHHLMAGKTTIEEFIRVFGE